jgi:hypothetical protein
MAVGSGEPTYGRDYRAEAKTERGRKKVYENSIGRERLG